jgi:hypothetical protein
MSHLEESVQKGDVVGPLLQCRVEQREGPVDPGGILSVGFVLGSSILCGQHQSEPQAHTLDTDKHTISQLVPPLAGGGRFASRALGRDGSATRLKGHIGWRCQEEDRARALDEPCIYGSLPAPVCFVVAVVVVVAVLLLLCVHVFQSWVFVPVLRKTRGSGARRKGEVGAGTSCNLCSL